MTATIATTVIVKRTAFDRPTLTLSDLRSFVAESAGMYEGATITLEQIVPSFTYVGEHTAVTIIARSESYEALGAQ